MRRTIFFQIKSQRDCKRAIFITCFPTQRIQFVQIYNRDHDLLNKSMVTKTWYIYIKKRIKLENYRYTNEFDSRRMGQTCFHLPWFFKRRFRSLFACFSSFFHKCLSLRSTSLRLSCHSFNFICYPPSDSSTFFLVSHLILPSSFFTSIFQMLHDTWLQRIYLKHVISLPFFL